MKDITRQFQTTGSIYRKLKRAGVDLLGGRAILKKMYPFTAAELGNDFSITNALTYGLKAFKEDYPEAKVVLLYMGDQQLLIDSILCVPCAAFWHHYINTKLQCSNENCSLKVSHFIK